MFTRIQYLNECAKTQGSPEKQAAIHRRYFGEIVEALGGHKKFTLPFSDEAIRDALKTDEHLNNLALEIWGRAASILPYGTDSALKVRGDFLTPAEGVSLLKEAARQRAEALDKAQKTVTEAAPVSAVPSPKQEDPGQKDDSGKLQWHLLPWKELQELVRVLMFGAMKYAPNNWQKVPEGRTRYFDAAVRHLVSWQQGESSDPESGLSHLAHAGVNVLFALWFERREKPE